MDNKKSVGIGIIGCGHMGRKIVRKLLAHDERLSVKAVFDPDQRSVDAALKQFGPSPVVCSDYHEMLDMEAIDWVMIASWNCHHCRQVVDAFEAGKHVFCQKPLAISLQECLRMLLAWKKSGRMFNIGFTLRYSPHYRRIKKLITDGCIGKIISMEFNETLDFNHGGYIMGDWRRLRKNAGTHLLEKCCHDIDLVNWIADSRAARVASFGGLDFFLPENSARMEQIGANPDGRKAYATWKQALIALDPFRSEKDIIDNQVAIIEYENRIRATFHTNCNAAIRERRMYILGSEGTIRADVLTGTIQVKRIGFDTETEDAATGASGGHGGGDEIMAGELAESMLRGKEPSVGLVAGIRSSVTCFAIDEAMERGKVVDVSPWWEEVEKCEIGEEIT